jgi:hypothetical protein
MDVIMQPGEEVTGRIRWEQPGLTLYGYVAGETKVATFIVWGPEPDRRDWTLTSSLPGQHDWRLSAEAPDALRKGAEGWLTEFVASLGASFPEADTAPEPREHDRPTRRNFYARPPDNAAFRFGPGNEADAAAGRRDLRDRGR